MASPAVTTPRSDELLQAALAGGQAQFTQLVEPYLREIHLHCYRMLGSFHDAQDATQETLLRAWRSLATFQGRGPLGAWLYRVATTTCLQLLRSRPPRRPGGNDGGPVVPSLEPYPDRLLEELPAGGPDPAAVAERRESVALAFVVALQRLTAHQRAVLILRDVLDWRAAEVAGLLETSVAAVNSALQRARASMRCAQPSTPVSAGSLPVQEREVLHRFMALWQRCDIQALAVADDAIQAITGFQDASLFDAFDLPQTLA